MFQLKIGSNKLSVLNVEDISLTFSLKDIKNYGQRNSSFSKKISIPKTAESNIIFKNLFNVNVINGYNISKQVYGELIEDGLVILKGNVEINEILGNSYEVTIASNNINLFNILGNKLITGNVNASDNISFAGNIYSHTYDPSLIRSTYMRSDPSNNGYGLMYALIDHDNTINSPDDIENDYPLIPCIAVKQIFNKIFSDNGYTYEADYSIESALDKLYIPYSGPITSEKKDWKCIRYFIGEADPYLFVDGSVAHFEGVELAKLFKIEKSNQDASATPYSLVEQGTIYGYYFDDQIDYINFTKDNSTYDYLQKHKVDDPSSYQFYTVPSATGYKIKVPGTYYITAKLNCIMHTFNDYTIDFQFYTCTADNKTNKVRSVPITAAVNGQNDFAFVHPTEVILEDTVEITEPDTELRLKIADYGMHTMAGPYATVNSWRPESASRFTYLAHHSQSLMTDPNYPYSEDVILYESACQNVVEVVKKDHIFVHRGNPANSVDASGVDLGYVGYDPAYTTYNLNSLLPINYKQADLVNDIFVMFNIFVEVDTIDPYKLYLKTFNNYYNNNIVDWTNKIDSDSLKITSIKNEFPNKINLKYKSDKDSFNQDYENKLNIPFGSKIIINDTDFNNDVKDINLSIAPTCLKLLDKAKIVTNPTSYRFGVEGGTICVSVNSAIPWEASEDSVWISLDGSLSGTGNGAFIVDASQQEHNGYERSTYVLLNTAYGPYYVSLTQDSSVAAPAISLNHNTITFNWDLDYCDEYTSILVTSTLPWTTYSPASWVIVSPAYGNAGTTEVYIYPNYEATENRMSYVDFKINDNTYNTCYIYQNETCE